MPNIDPVIGEKLVRIWIKEDDPFSTQEVEIYIVTRASMTEAHAWNLAEQILASDFITENSTMENPIIQTVVLTDSAEVTEPV